MIWYCLSRSFQGRKGRSEEATCNQISPAPSPLLVAETQELLEWQPGQPEASRCTQISPLLRNGGKGFPQPPPQRPCIWGNKTNGDPGKRWKEEEKEGGQESIPRSLYLCWPSQPAGRAPATLQRPGPVLGKDAGAAGRPRPCQGSSRDLLLASSKGQAEHALGRQRALPKPRRRAGTALVSGAGEAVAPDKGPRAKPLLPRQRPAPPGTRRSLGGRKEARLAASRSPILQKGEKGRV